jgi:hypothetical protein
MMEKWIKALEEGKTVVVKGKRIADVVKVVEELSNRCGLPKEFMTLYEFKKKLKKGEIPEDKFMVIPDITNLKGIETEFEEWINYRVLKSLPTLIGTNLELEENPFEVNGIFAYIDASLLIERAEILPILEEDEFDDIPSLDVFGKDVLL